MMADNGWQRKFEDPITLPDGRDSCLRFVMPPTTSPACRKRKPTCRIGKSQWKRCCWCREVVPR